MKFTQISSRKVEAGGLKISSMDTKKSLADTSDHADPLVTRPARVPSIRRAVKASLATFGLTLALGASAPVRAADGCLAMLCLAAPSWRSIEQCVATVVEVLSDLAHGKPFPSCDMAGAGNNASLKWSDPPTFCPPQYMTSTELESSTTYQCQFEGAVEVNVNGQLWTRIWWNEGDSVTEFSVAAKAQLGSWDPRFDNDYAVWLATQAPPAPPCSSC
jgi:hypothetical protein